MMTVQAPQVPRSHTRLAAVRSRRCRKVSNNVLRGSTLVLYGLPLICSVMGTSPGPATLALVCASASFSRIPVVRTPLVTPTPCRKPRREKFDLGLRFSGSCLKLTGHLPLGGNLIDLSKRLDSKVLWLQPEPHTSNQQRQNDQRDYGIGPIPLEREAGSAGQHAHHRRGDQDQQSKLNNVKRV